MTPGELVVLLGRNGAGKSTRMQIAHADPVGPLRRRVGTASVFGFDIGRNLTRALARLGVVFQLPTLDLEISAQGSLLYHSGLHALSRSEALRRIEALLTAENLFDRRHERAGNLSGGNRRKVELVRALLHGPQLLLMDKATVGLHPASRQDLLNRMTRLCAEGLVVLWTTHLVDEAEKADWVVILHDGAICFDDCPAVLLSHSCHTPDRRHSIAPSSS